MKNFETMILGYFTHPQKQVQRLLNPWIAFYLKGFQRLKIYNENKSLLFNAEKQNLPAVFIGMPGMVMDFIANDERENWVAILRTDMLRKSDDNSVDFQLRDNWVQVPMISQIAKEESGTWQREFRDMHNAYLTPHPANIMRVELGLLNVIRHILDQSTQSDKQRIEPAERLKKLIDNDKALQYNLSELSERCGYSSDHLRIIFQKKYKISPLEYRKRQRMSNAMNLIINSNLLVKEISDKVGFCHVTHFCTAFKKEYNMSPAQAIKLNRQSVTGSDFQP